MIARSQERGQEAGAVPGATDGPARLVLVRHGATAWSRSGRHTGRTDLPLDEGGRAQAEDLGERLAELAIDRVLTSPLTRARATCELAGFGAKAEVVDDLVEWDYGAYEGLTTPEIRAERPSWQLFRDGCPGGEVPEGVGARADAVLGLVAACAPGSTVALFGHGHLLRVLAARWLALAPAAGQLLALDAGSVSVLGHEREARVVRSWNA